MRPARRSAAARPRRRGDVPLVPAPPSRRAAPALVPALARRSGPRGPRGRRRSPARPVSPGACVGRGPARRDEPAVARRPHAPCEPRTVLRRGGPRGRPDDVGACRRRRPGGRGAPPRAGARRDPAAASTWVHPACGASLRTLGYPVRLGGALVTSIQDRRWRASSTAARRRPTFRAARRRAACRALPDPRAPAPRGDGLPRRGTAPTERAGSFRVELPGGPLIVRAGSLAHQAG